MRWGVLVLAVLLLALSSCASGGTGVSPGASSVATSAAGSPSSASSPSRVAGPVATIVAPPGSSTGPQGADAAPAATWRATSGSYDPSQAAVDAFRLWMEYETEPSLDPGKNVDQDAHPDGVAACAQLALNANPAAIESQLKDTKGWSGTGASAVVKGAMNALCPWRNSGYRTYFDRQVTIAYQAVNGRIAGGVETNENGIGWFGKATCNYLNASGAVGLEAYLYSFRAGGANAATQAAVFVQTVADDPSLRRAAYWTTLHLCPADNSKLLHWSRA